MKKEKLGKIVRRTALLATCVSIVGCGTNAFPEETKPFTSIIIDTEKDLEDFSYTMGEAAIEASEVIGPKENPYISCMIKNSGSNEVSVDWFCWNESEIQYNDYCPVQLKSDYSTGFYMNGMLENSVYLIHINSNGMDKYIAFRPKVK